MLSKVRFGYYLNQMPLGNSRNVAKIEKLKKNGRRRLIISLLLRQCHGCVVQSPVIKLSLRKTIFCSTFAYTCLTILFSYSKFFVFLVSVFRMLAKDELVATLEKCVDILTSSSAKCLRKALEKLERYVHQLKNLEGTAVLL